MQRQIRVGDRHGSCNLFLPDGKVSNKEFAYSSILRLSPDSPPDQASLQPTRRLIVLEDLPRNHIEDLGSRL